MHDQNHDPNEITKRKRKCPRCHGVFAKRYLQRHFESCTSLKEAEKCLVDFDDDVENIFPKENIFQTRNRHDVELEEEDVNDSEENSSDGELSIEDDIDEDILEMTNELFNDENVTVPCLEKTLDTTESQKLVTVITWICLFLSLWQYFFNISDGALEVLIKFLKGLFSILVENFELKAPVAAIFPASIYLFHRMHNSNAKQFKTLVTCTKCFKLYDFGDASQVLMGERISKKCNFVRYPSHPKKHLRKPCGQELLKKVKVGTKTVLIPHKTYCYKPLRSSLDRLFKRKGFREQCLSWKERKSSSDILTDVYDGEIWQDFIKAGTFFEESGIQLGLMVNCDWFSPYKHVKTCSVGAIYAVIMNLPRKIRFKKENVILIGLIPNMVHEPPTNTFLKPFVDDLLVAWNTGFNINGETIKCALLCIGCDMPASRKLCGFLGHSATKACNKCKKNFPGGFGNKNYGGFHRDSWEPRTNQEHRRQMTEITRAATQTERKAMESEYGTRFTVLSELPYVDAIRMTIIDPMHNLFLGTSKRMIAIWKDLGYLTKQNVVKIQETLDEMVCSDDVGKLPSKIEDFNFDSFTADELKNWTLIFSLFCLKKVLPNEHYQCWQTFVMACVYLCNQAILRTDITVVDCLLMKFCRTFERLYGSEKVTPNIHMHCHLAKCLTDFGPVYNFWLFSFERYNGILGSLPSNKKNIENQLMRRFERDLDSLCLPYPDIMSSEFTPLIQSLFPDKDGRGSVRHFADVCYENLKLSSWKTDYSTVKWYDVENIEINRSRKVHHLNETEYRCLESMYKIIYPDTVILVHKACWKLKEIVHNDDCYGSEASRSIRSSHIMAFWAGENGEIEKYENMYTAPRPGKISYFLKHTVLVNGHYYDHVLARIEWYLPANNMENYFGKPIVVFRDSFFELSGAASFMPVQRIFCKFVHARANINRDNLLVVAPRYRHLNI